MAPSQISHTVKRRLPRLQTDILIYLPETELHITNKEVDKTGIWQNLRGENNLSKTSLFFFPTYYDNKSKDIY